MRSKEEMQEELKEIRRKRDEAKKDFKNRALMVIETLVEGDIVYEDMEKLKSDIFRIAHSAVGTCVHPDWDAETEKLFKEFEKAGLI